MSCLCDPSRSSIVRLLIRAEVQRGLITLCDAMYAGGEEGGRRWVETNAADDKVAFALIASGGSLLVLILRSLSSNGNYRV